ncbi:MAG TPA: homoserine dehydrogenase [Blastocatellia bacterium]|nr:homoserine dehydrogenase [Blastocatellia bacterium]
MQLKLAFVGFGNVARAFARMLDERRAILAEQYDINWRATAIATGNHGCILASNIDLNEAVASVERGENLTTLKDDLPAANSLEVIERCDADIIFETSPLNAEDGEPAVSHIRGALARGINVVTANKGPVAFAYRELKSMADERNVSFRFEGTVMDGAPIFNLAEYCLPAARVKGFYGVLNSTTNLILTEMERGRPFDDALKIAQSMGVAEANADYDIDGWDAAVKAVAIANVLMNADLRPKDVHPTGIRNITIDDLKEAAREGFAIRLVARAETTSAGLAIKVAPERAPMASAIASVRGTSNVLVLETDLMGELAIFENDPGVEQTAYALLSDMIRIQEIIGTARERP